MLDIVAQIIPLLAMRDVIDKFIIMFVDSEPARHALTTSQLENNRGTFAPPSLAESDVSGQRQRRRQQRRPSTTGTLSLKNF